MQAAYFLGNGVAGTACAQAPSVRRVLHVRTPLVSCWHGHCTQRARVCWHGHCTLCAMLRCNGNSGALRYAKTIDHFCSSLPRMKIQKSGLSDFKISVSQISKMESLRFQKWSLSDFKNGVSQISNAFAIRWTRRRFILITQLLDNLFHDSNMRPRKRLVPNHPL
jgi:hypothetical protein